VSVLAFLLGSMLAGAGRGAPRRAARLDVLDAIATE
jgi:hypothetical protein